MAQRAVVPLVDGVIWRVPLVGDFVNGFLLRDDDGQVTILDMGLPRSAPRVLAALTAIGSGPSDVTRLLLTHAHIDHVGGAAAVAAAVGRGVAVHAEDAQYVREGRGPARDPTYRLGRLLDRLSPTRFGPVQVAEELLDGQLLPVAGGLRVIHTPGHSPGHAAYLHEPSGTLVTGDSIFNVRGLRWPFTAFCTDFRLTQQTAHRLAETEYERAAFTHGAPLTDNPREAIRSFLSRQGW
ncbi:MAG: MBL fold metallo-hydrolase [Dermatophilaceae bacterium]